MDDSSQDDEFLKLSSTPVLVSNDGRYRTYNVDILGQNVVIQVDEIYCQLLTSAVPHLYNNQYVDFEENVYEAPCLMTDYCYSWKTVKRSQKFGYSSAKDLHNVIRRVLNQLVKKSKDSEDEDDEPKEKWRKGCGGTKKKLIDEGDDIDPRTICRLVPASSSACAEIIDRFFRLYSATLMDMINFEFHQLPMFSHRVVQFFLACAFIRDINIKVPANCNRITSHQRLRKSSFFERQAINNNDKVRYNMRLLSDFRKELRKKQRKFERQDKQDQVESSIFRKGVDITKETQEMKELAAALVQRRQELNWTRDDVCDEIGEDLNNLGRFEKSSLAFESATRVALLISGWLEIHRDDKPKQRRKFATIARNVRDYKCQVCNFETTNETRFNDHLVNVHQIYRLICNICGHKFGKKNVLNEHKKIHEQ